MLLLSECYADLGLHIAARYYAAGAMYIAVHSDDDNIHRLAAKAGFALAQTFYSAGEGMTYIFSLRQIIGLHLTIAQDPTNLQRHQEFQRALLHAAIFRAVAHRLAPHLDDDIEVGLSSWPIAKADIDKLMGLATTPESPWTTMSVAQIEDAIERDLGLSPFNDVGDPVEISWSALGIRWTVRHCADRATKLAALELVAALQVAHAELAGAELLVIPTTALIIVETGQVGRPDLQQLPSNDSLIWKIVLPLEWPNANDLNPGFPENVAAAIAVIGQATALDCNAFQSVIRESFERGLAQRAFSVRPARELMDFALFQADGVDDLNRLNPVQLSRPINLLEPSELAWRSTPGPGYTREKAEKFLANRYRRTSEIISLTLPRILADQAVRALLLDLRARGFLDWQILAMLTSIVAQYQVEARAGQPFGPGMERDFQERMSRPEREDDPVFDTRIIDKSRLQTQATVMLPAVFQTWGLAVHRHTPDLVGMKRLLDVRYRHSTDDIPHAELLQ